MICQNKTKRILSLTILLLSFLLGTNINAAECRVIGSRCVDGPATKNISGQMITKDCWKYEDTYECLDPNNIDYCQALAATPGCSISSSRCTLYDFAGTCTNSINTYRCGNNIAPPAGTIKLEDTHTIIFDSINTAPCATYADNPSCQLSAKVCIEGPSTKVINGMSVYKDCWKWREDYNCLVHNPIDYCMPLKQAGCEKKSETCSNYAFTGECIEKKFTYKCGDSQNANPEVVYLETTYTITKDSINNSACQSFDDNPNCTLAEQTCIEGAETRNINGLEVYKSCWKWKKDYVCASENLTSTCEEFLNDPKCTETGSTCVDYLPSGSCGLLERQFKCTTSEATTSTQADCSGQRFCMDGNCFDTGYPPDGDFTKVVALMEALRQAGTNELFKGEANFCSQRLFGIKNCCKSSSGGAASRNDAVARQLGVTGLTVGYEVVRVHGSEYVFDALYNSGSTMLQTYAMEQTAANAFMGSNIFGSFSLWGAQFTYSAASGLTFVGFDPWSLAFSIAMQVITQMMACDQEDQETAIRKGQNLCHKVGSFCAKKVLKACVTKKESYCCFPSVLGKIINVQGRAQIGKSWGSEKNPDCSGFTTEELEKLRFEEMDLSEFINTITAPMKSEGFAVQRLNEKVRSYYEP